MTPHYDDSFADVFNGVTNWRMWSRMGWQELRRRYRRTVIGPFWTTLSLGVFIFTLGFLWAHLWREDPKAYLPFLCSGMITWVFISSIVTEGCSAFTSAESLIKQINVPYTLLICTVVWRNLMVFIHNFVIFVLLVPYAGVLVNGNTLLVLPGMLIICLSGIWVVALLGMVCARYRDVQQLVTTLLQIALFLTPIFYSPAQLQGGMVSIAQYNPLYHYIELVRLPLLGQLPSALDYAIGIGGTVLGWAFTFDLYSRFRRRVPYWL
jgi:homopolymeric O-antigen transport system permease protein